MSADTLVPPVPAVQNLIFEFVVLSFNRGLTTAVEKCEECWHAEWPGLQEDSSDEYVAHTGASEEVEVAETGHDEEGRGQHRVEPPDHLARHPLLEAEVGRVGGRRPGQALQRDAEEVEERPDEHKVHRPVPHIHEGEADGAAQELEDEGGGEEGDDG